MANTMGGVTRKVAKKKLLKNPTKAGFGKGAVKNTRVLPKVQHKGENKGLSNEKFVVKRTKKVGAKAKAEAAKAGAKAVAKAGAKAKGKKPSREEKAAGKKMSDGIDKRMEAQKRKAEDAKKDGEAGAKDGKKQDPKMPARWKRAVFLKQRSRKEVTKLYEELISPAEKEGTRKGNIIVGEILELLKERKESIDTYSSKRVGSRVMQACLKWGSSEQRKAVLTLVQEHIPRLAMDRYGHVVIQKLLIYIAKTSTQRKPNPEELKAQAANLKAFLTPFAGKNLHSIFYQKYGCRVVNSIYFSPVVSARDKRRILHDVAVPSNVALMRSEAAGNLALRQLLKGEELSAEHRKEVVANLEELAIKCVDKELLGLEIVHLLFQIYCESANESQLKDIAEKALPGAPHLLSSKPGAEAVLRLLGLTSAKNKKNFCKDLKGKFAALAMNAVDYLVVMRLASTVDDTVMMSKGMLAELVPEMANLCADKYGFRVLSWLLCPDDKRFFSPYERECLALPAPTAVKSSDTRRQEMLRVLKSPLQKVLVESGLKIAGDEQARNLLIAYLAAGWDGEVVEALLKACKAEASAKKFGLLGGTPATSTLMALLKLEPADTKSPLAMPLWTRVFEPTLLASLTSHSVRVIVALLAKGDKVKAAVLKSVRSKQKEIEAAAKQREGTGEAVTNLRQVLAAATGA